MQNSGQVAPLDEIIRLKEKYRFRVILDENHSFGVLGNSGRGLAEYYGVPVGIHFYLFLPHLIHFHMFMKRDSDADREN